MKKIDICVGTDRGRNIRVRLSLMYVDDDTQEIISEHYHSGVLQPGDDPQALRTAWEIHLATPGGGIPGAPWPAIPDEEWAEVLAMIPILHTPSRIAKVAQERAAAKSKFQAFTEPVNA